MKFGRVPLDEAVGAILAHRHEVGGRFLPKGTALSLADVADLAAAGFDDVMVAKLAAGDVGEDGAAATLAASLCGAGVRVAPASLGRVNLFAASHGLLRFDSTALLALNLFDEAITLATLPNFTRVRAGDMLATLKIIPYAVAAPTLAGAEDLARAAALSVKPWQGKRLIALSTFLKPLKRSVIDKTVTTLTQRLKDTGATLVAHEICRHEIAPLSALIAAHAHDCDGILIYGASAIADRLDVVPASVVAAGGKVQRFGMPVDPGNLLALGAVGNAFVLGAPGCARSPKRNGFDLVLERLLCGMAVSAHDIARMGEGGLLKDIATRPVPRHKQAGLDGDGVEVS